MTEAGVAETLAGELRPSGGVRVGILRTVRENPVFVACGLILLFFIVIAALADVVAPYAATDQDILHTLEGPSRDHLLGTEQLGRDILSRTVYGARISLAVGLSVMLIGGALAALIGGISGYAGGWIDASIQRVVDAFMSIPSLILLMTVLNVIGPSLTKIILVMGIQFSIGASRTVRSAVLSVKVRPYVEAAHAVGVHPARIYFLHVMPNVMAVVIVVATLMLGSAILVEAALSFLGFGVPPPTATWGGMLAGPNRHFAFIQQWMVLAPGICLFVVLVAANLFGDGLRDILDPRLRGAR